MGPKVYTEGKHINWLPFQSFYLSVALDMKDCLDGLADIKLALDSLIARFEKEHPTSMSCEKLIKCLPLKNKEELDQFENLLRSSSIEQELIMLIRKTGGASAKNLTVRVLKKIFQDSFAQTCSWLGQRNNLRVCNLKTIAVIRVEHKFSWYNEYDKPQIPLGRMGKLDFNDGFLYVKSKKFPNKWYLKCASYATKLCKASFLVSINEDGSFSKHIRCVVPHNHPPDQLAVQTEKFLEELKRAVSCFKGNRREMYNFLAQSYPEVAEVYTYNAIAKRLYRWEKQARNSGQLARNIGKIGNE